MEGKFGRRALLGGLAGAAIAGKVDARSERRIIIELDRKFNEYVENLSDIQRHWFLVYPLLNEDFNSKNTPEYLLEKYPDHEIISEIVTDIISTIRKIEEQLSRYSTADTKEKEGIIHQCDELFVQYGKLNEEITKIEDYHLWLDEHLSDIKEAEHEDI